MKHLSYKEFMTLYGDLGLTKWVKYNWLQVIPYDDQWDQQWEHGGISGSTGQNAPADDQIRSKNYIKVEELHPYYFKCPSTLYIMLYDSEHNFITGNIAVSSNSIYFIPSGTSYIRFKREATTYNKDISIYKLHNCWDEEWEVGGLDTSNGQPTVYSGIRSKYDDPISVNPNTTYYIKGETIYPFFYDEDDNYISCQGSSVTNGTFTTPANCKYVRFSVYTSYGTTYKNDIAIVYLEDL